MVNNYKLSFSSLKNLAFFPRSLIKTVFPEIKDSSLHQKITRLLKRGDFIQLKKGLYTTSAYYEKHQGNFDYRVKIANILRYPSYVSGAYMLQRYGMMADITHPITSVTLKSSRKYSNALGDFFYYSISEKLYTGYLSEKNEEGSTYFATRVKALFDFFYFKYWNVKNLPEDLKERERIDYSALKPSEIGQFKKYCELSYLKHFKILPHLLFDE